MKNLFLVILLLSISGVFGQNLNKRSKQKVFVPKNYSEAFIKERLLKAKKINLPIVSSVKSTKAGLNLVDSLVGKTWDGEESVFINQWKEVYVYNADDMVDSVVYFLWDVLEDNWVRSTKNTYEYNGDNQIELHVSYSYDKLNQVWENSVKEESSYNGNGMLEQFLSYTWNTDTWGIPWKETYTYYPSNKVKDWISYWNDGSGYVNYSKYSYEYDSNQRENLVTAYNWNETEWLAYEKIEKSYDAEGRIEIATAYSFNTTWENSGKDEYSYPSNEAIYIYYNWSGTDWTAQNKEVRHFTSGIKDSYILYRYDADEWVENYKELYSYDAEDIIESTETFQYNTNLTQWLVSDVINYYYIQDITGLCEIIDANIVAFPNPVSEYLNFQSDKNIECVQIMDISGKMVFSQLCNGQKIQIDFSGFNSGVYFVKIQQTEGFKNIQIIKK